MSGGFCRFRVTEDSPEWSIQVPEKSTQFAGLV